MSISIRRRTVAFAAVLAALAAPIATATGPAGAWELPPRDYATWHEYGAATAGGSPGPLVVAPGDIVWYADTLENEIVKVPAAAPAMVEHFRLGALAPGISDLAAASDGTIWFGDFLNAGIGRLDPATGDVTEYPLGGAFDMATSLTNGPDGALWFGDPSNGGIGRIALDGTITRVPDPAGAGVYGIAAADDGRLWYTRDGYGSLGAYDPVTGALDIIPVGVSGFTGLTAAASGGVWVGGIDTVVKVATDGTVTKRITIPSPSFSPVVPRHLVSADDVDLAFTDGERGLGRVDLWGNVSFSKPPFAGSQPEHLGVTSYGSLWYSDLARQTLGNG
ncbi:hypothetical protein ITJ64_02885 [Herbiconiux sp. VKM Ac-1786]|uniref:Vgb family protein n=1 Tax=Herbiconiux sp. VKM Ac-1786 TaxID=2783824 RepID=UPI00188BDB1E|nr:hypothetical protein [Herbiconiux sp. VKM Ac-1786]MBF4571454.1 hypothetical protein [Herbiconiux sp. VKM Ac-1786]